MMHTPKDLLATYPSNMSQTIGFEDIKIELSHFASTRYGKRQSLHLHPSHSEQTVGRLMSQTKECMQLLLLTSFPDLKIMDDITTQLSSLNLQAQIPETELLHKLHILLKDTIHFIDQFKEHESSFYHINKVVKNVLIPTDMFTYLEKILDEEGHISPYASPELQAISDLILKKEKEVRQLLAHRFEIARKNGWAGDTEMTIRNERLVIPIISEHKKKIKGLVHDISATGKFLYIEPIECFDENNRLKELYIERKREIDHILRKAGLLIHASITALQHLFRMWETLDFIAAKAKFTRHTDGQFVQISSKNHYHLSDAIHPKIKQSLGSKAVKNTVTLHQNTQILLISGPNAGGKSILLKTCALLQMMFQCGIGITASPNSSLPVFKQLFTDISDNQSIDNALSTYSAHLVHMKYILEHANEHTLLCMDELGSGTDPDQGTPIAEVMLEQLCQTGTYGLITTHLGQLKKIPERFPHLENASMKYDPYKLKPLYTLEVGMPGQSFALELVTGLHYPNHFITKVKQKREDSEHLHYEEKILQLQKKIHDLERQQSALHEKENHLNVLMESYRKLKTELTEKQKDILYQSQSKALELLRETQVFVKKIQKEARNTSKEELKKADLSLQQKTISIQKNISSTQSPAAPPPSPSGKKQNTYEIQPNQLPQAGDMVMITDNGQMGELLEINNQHAIIALGELRSKVAMNRLVKVTMSTSPKKRSSSSYLHQLENRQKKHSPSIDIRGERGEYAMSKVEQYLDETYMIGVKTIKIVHGHGDGVLKKMLKDCLKSHHSVEKWEYEHIEKGGDGATIVFLR
jgi:DNA mismatch repair protein MutS2